MAKKSRKERKQETARKQAKHRQEPIAGKLIAEKQKERSQKECFADLLANPSQETRDAYVEIVGKRAAKGYQKESRGQFLKLLRAYAENGSAWLLDAAKSMDVYFWGKDSENQYVQMIKLTWRGCGGRGREIRQTYLGKCNTPEALRKSVRNRLLSKALKVLRLQKIGKALGSVKLFRAVAKPFKAAGDFIGRQYQYKKNGYTRYTLNAWKQAVEKDLQECAGKDPLAVKWAHKNGFLYHRVHQYGLTEENVRSFISDRDYILLNPINNSYKMWIEDIPSLRICVSETAHLQPKIFYHVLRRYGKALYVRMPDCPEGYQGGSEDEVLRLIRARGGMTYTPAAPTPSAKTYNIGYYKGSYYVAGEKVSEKYVRRILNTQQRFYVLRERVAMRKDLSAIGGKRVTEMRAIILNPGVHFPDVAELVVRVAGGGVIRLDPRTGSADGVKIAGWDAIRGQLLEFANAVPQLEYYALNFVVTESGVKITSAVHHPALLRNVAPTPAIMEFLTGKRDRRMAGTRKILSWQRLEGKFWTFLRTRFGEPGYQDFMFREYVTGIVTDIFTFHRTSLKQKLWCYRRGYPSYRLAQYELNDDNWDKILSDRDYHWLSPINNVYVKWIDDKMTYRKSIGPFADVCPKYYYHIMNRNGIAYAITMEDCPKGYESSFEGIMELLKVKGALAVKQAAGSHGDGFFKIGYVEGKYFLGSKESSYEEIINKLRGLERFYNVTEFLSMHEELRHIYPGSVNTIRVMMLNPTGCDPIIANAYMRVGSSSSNMTDNVGLGGIAVQVDADTGRYHSGAKLKDHFYVPCPVHPDTNVLIEGVLPDWEEAKKVLIGICNYYGQLEYLGFDVALTSDGVKIIEINKHQDLHRCAYYGDTVQEFFRTQIAEKRRLLKVTGKVK